ncbi:glutaredoxin domain-containing protein [Aliiglaciecola sp. CAU 1673]|uniref:glutaredoxin domain-containing protein n=1 Tax=Aliiglaciecola sp. CAU 1673 TaxID=3032595 RepID=UPI0023DC33F1|nr:glutaredoxin domain-containing protein [Aliiglaciecola sp. CAU 1673]MDF2178088.1 glutaredoxin domain-containing protein [Aliiglaciecola sp. CAU 1673]
MANVEVYTSPGCAYCTMVKRLFDNKGVTYQEYDVYAQPEHLSELRRRTQGRTFPQVFIDGVSVGGYEDILKLDQQQRLSV